MKSIATFKKTLQVLVIVMVTAQIHAQGIKINSGGYFNINGNATIHIHNGNLENNGTYTKANERLIISGNEEHSISGNNLDLYHLMVINSEGIVSEVDLLTTSDLDIENECKFIIKPGKNVTVNNTLTNESGQEGLIIKSDVTGTGSLIHHSDNVQATVERFVTGNSWHYMFAPLTSIPTTIYTVEGPYNNLNIFSYNESTADYWDAIYTYGTTGWVSEYGNSYLLTNKGYIYNRYNMPNKTFSQTGGYLTAVDKVFNVSYTKSSGEIGNGVTQGWDNFDGWNLLGNPYTSAIDWDMIVKDDIEAGVYVYDGVNYQYYINGGGSSIWDVGITLNGGSNFIPAGQGFFVKVKDTGSTHSGTFTIPENARVHNGIAFWKKSISEVPNIIKMSISSGDFSDETVIRTIPWATDGQDPDYDAYKIFSWDQTKPQIFSACTELSNLFAVNTFPEVIDEKTVILGIKTGIDGYYAINTINNTFTGYNVYLEDKLLNKITNVVLSPIYSFYTESGYSEERFALHINLNHAPISKVEDIEINEDTELLLNLANTFYDIDLSDQVNIIVTEMPQWLTANGLLFSGTPTNDDVGKHIVGLRASDLNGAITEVEFTIVVNNTNDAPELVLPLPDYYGEIGIEMVIEIDFNSFRDVDPGDVLSYTSNYPSWLNFSGFMLSYYGIPIETGIENVTLTAHDIAGAEVTGDFNIYISPTTSNTVENQGNLNIYPNPTHGVFISESDLFVPYTIRIFDLTGNLIKQYSDVMEHRFTIDLSDHTNGIYYIELSSENQLFREKILKY